MVPPKSAPQRPSGEGFAEVEGAAELKDDVVLLEVIDTEEEDEANDVVTPMEARTISVVYNDLVTDSIVVVKVTVFPELHGSGEYVGSCAYVVLCVVDRLGRLGSSLTYCRGRSSGTSSSSSSIMFSDVERFFAGRNATPMS